jgi:uncharacterized protein (DUF58 family)
MRARVTLGGWLFLAGTAAVGAAALLTGNNLLFLILAAMLAMLLISNFVARLSLAGLELDLLLPEHLPARQKLSARVWVRNTKRWTPAFSIRLSGAAGSVVEPLYFPLLPGARVVEAAIQVTFPRRGPHHEDAFLFTSSFPFGFLVRHAPVELRRQVLVYPSIQPQPGFEDLWKALRGDLEIHQRGRGHDFYRIRPYEALESARHVDWKATAHTGALQVREFAREEERRLEVFLDLDVPEPHRDWFEQAVDCCAFLAWRTAERGRRLRLRCQDFDLIMPEQGDVYDVLKRLALVRYEPAKPPLLPEESEAYQLVFSARDPQRLAEAGWRDARLLGPGELPVTQLT